jgi:hypothetical protein
MPRHSTGLAWESLVADTGWHPLSGTERRPQMLRTVRKRVIVKKGKVIEIRSPELPPPGTPADVVVTFDAPAKKGQTVSLSSFFGSAKGGFATPLEVDAFIRRERDSWES